MSKLRQFWIEEESDSTEAQVVSLIQCASFDAIHVIEFSAFEALREENELLKAKLDVLRRYHGGDGTITRDMIFDTLGSHERTIE
jgi:hypothetical protein